MVATGSTVNGREEKWVRSVQSAAPVLLAFDDDRNGASDTAADFWLKQVSHAIRWFPWAHDVNDMLTEGINIPLWIETGMSVADHLSKEREEDSLTCVDCGMDGDAAPEEVIFSYDEIGRSYCPMCWQKRQSPPGALEGSRYDQFFGAVQQIATAWPGGCEIHVDPPGYTREDRVKEIEQQERERVRYPRVRVVS